VEIHLTPELEAELSAMASATGRATDELVQAATSTYLEELANVREMLDRRYDEVKADKVKPIGGEAFFESLRQREHELIKRRSPQ